MQNKINLAIDNITLLIMSIFLGYTFWFQYAFYEISGLLTLLGILMGFLFFLRIRLNLTYYRYIGYVLTFLLVCTITGSLVTENTGVFVELLTRIIRYIVPLLCLYNYIGTNYERAKKIMYILSVVIFALAVSLITRGTVNRMGATVLGDLNANVFSSFLLLGIAANFFLINGTKSKFINSLLITFLVVELFAQTLAGSRRGILVFLFMVLTYIHSVVTIKLYNKTATKIVFLLLILVSVAMLVVNISSMSDNLFIINEFRRTSGDSLRAAYQQVAWNQFLSSPLVGLGLGAVQVKIGMYSHSLYYELLACTGILGVVFLLVPQFKSFLFFWKCSILSGNIERRMQARMMAWLIVSMLITGIAVVYFYDAVFYILLSIVASMNNIYNYNVYGKIVNEYE